MKNLFILFNLLCLPLFAQEKIDFISYEELRVQLREAEQEGAFETALKLINRVHPNDSIYCTSLTSKSYYLLNLDRIEEALEVTENGIRMDCDKQSKMYFYMNTGYAYNQLKRYDDALQLYDEALVEFPKSASLWYNKGVIYKESNQLAKAAECLIQAIKYEPTYSNAHYNLGDIIYRQEESSLGLMALSMSVFSKPDEDGSLNKLTVLNETLTTKNSNQATENNIDPDQGNFKQLDLILDNLVAIDENYQVDHKIPISLVKQMHVFFEQMDNYKGNGGFWDQAYIPFFQWVKEKNYFDEFMYLILYSNTNEAFKKIIQKEEKNIIAFAEKAYYKWYDIVQRLNTELPEKEGYKGLYSYDNGHVHGVGLAKDDVAFGKWDFYSDSGYQTSGGEYNSASERTGVWQFYDKFGNLSEVNNHHVEDENIDIERYYSNVQLEYSYTLKNDEPHGNYQAFTYYGALKQEKHFKDGKLQGPYAAYFDTGKTHIEFEANYVDGEIDGELIEYYSDGDIYSIITYKNGIQNGKEVRYARNGEKSFEVNVIDDLAEGSYTTYHLNGQVFENGKVEGGKEVGLWQTFDQDGTLTSSYHYNSKGELDGQYIVYEKEKKQIEYTYKKGEIVAYACYDDAGKELISKKKKKGKFYFKSFYLNGNPSTEGEYNVEGGKIGVWKEYYPTGILQEEGVFKENTQVGEFIYYHPSGKVSQKLNYNEKGELHGYASYYFEHGQMSMQGWYQDGSEQGVWESYFKDGTIQSRSFFHKGKLSGERSFFSVDGTIVSKEQYTNGLLDTDEYFDQNEKVYDKITLHQDDEAYTITFKGITYPREVEAEYLNGIRNGNYTGFDIDGTPKVKGKYLVGGQHGKWEWFKDGKLAAEANYQFNDLHGKLTRYTEKGDVDYIEFYEYGNRIGEWLNYHENGELSVKEYFKNDELQGKKSLYNPQGNLQINLFYDEGRLIAFSYLDENQSEIPKIEVENQTAKVVAYYPNGNKAQEFSIQNGLYEGDFIVYHESGQIRYQKTYINGLRNGNHDSFYEDGTIEESIPFYQDEVHGEFKTYHKNGELASSTTYKLGKKHGEALYYNKNAELTKKELYYDDNIYERETY